LQDWNSPVKNSVDPAWPPPHRCRTFPLLLTQIKVWPLLRIVSVAQKNRPSTMFSFIVQSIDLFMDHMAWRFWMTEKSNGNTCPDILCGLTVDWKNSLKRY